MISKKSALELAIRRINSSYYVQGDCLVVIDEATIEKEYGWIFFYDSKKYIETNDKRYLIAGNAPILIEKSDGSIHILGTAMPVERYIEQYEREHGIRK
jgi:hypothetical protein